ncbi:MAG: EF-hand domain-containing protein [Pseudomonadota bacterium]
MNRLLKITTIATLSLALGAGAAFADKDRRGGGMRAADTNNDGSVSLEEFQANLAERFAAFDSDSNGTVTAAEVQAIVSASDDRKITRQAQRVRAMDADWDGQLTTAEVQTASAAMFDRLDTNDDGKLDRADRRGKRGKNRGGGNSND